MKVVVLTTSYPRDESDVAGHFVASSVRVARAAGIEVEVVSPASFRDFGIAYGGGVVQNLRAAPWKAALVPAFLAAFARAAREATRDADLVHAHWIPSAIAARATGRPYVLQVWGTDVALARRIPMVARPLVHGARVVVASSSFLAGEASALGARDVRIAPPSLELPSDVGAPDEPPHVLFAGRLSEEKGILEFVEATDGLRRVIVGDGPLRSRVPEALGFVPAVGGRRVLPQRDRRLRAVATRRLRVGRSRGTGACAARRRDPRRRAGRPGRRRRAGGPRRRAGAASGDRGPPR